MIAYVDVLGHQCSHDIISALTQIFNPKSRPPTFDEIINDAFVPLTNFVTKHVGQVTCVVDGLDESTPRTSATAFRAIDKLMKVNNILVLISGREDLDLTRAIPLCFKINISKNDSFDDIQAFLDWRMEEKTGEKQLSENPQLLEEVKEKLLEKAHCM